MWRRFMQIMTTIAAIIIVILAIVAGVKVSEATEAGGFGFVVFLTILLFGFVLIGTTGMIVEGVEYLETIAYYEAERGKTSLFSGQGSTRQNGAPTANPYSENTAYNTVKISNAKGKSILEASEASSGEWICSQCKEKNRAESVFCRYCGTHK